MIVANTDIVDATPVTSGPVINALILDDSKFDRRRIRRLSRETGLAIDLDEVASLESLQQVLDKEDFDVILIDYQLPQGNGIEAIELVRNHARNAGCPTIMVAGEEQTDIAVKAVKMGCAAYISKDKLTVELLRASIVEAIEQAKAQADSSDRMESAAELIAQEVMSKYSTLLRPEMARIVRDLRRLRTSLSMPGVNLPGGLQEVEARSLQVWSALGDPEQMPGLDLEEPDSPTLQGLRYM